MANHFKECLKITNEFRAKNRMGPLTITEAYSACNLLSLDPKENPNVFDLVGPEKGISLSNLERQPITIEEDEIN